MAGENSGGRAAPPPIPAPRTMRERFGALRNLPPFLKLVWRTSPALTVGDLALRLVRALLPVATLYVGKLIIDEVIRLAGAHGVPFHLGDWLTGGRLDHLAALLAIEFGLAVLSDGLGRVVSLLDSLLSEQFTNATSVRMADRILVLADGRVEAMGTHEELLARGGRYAELFELQAAGYR